MMNAKRTILILALGTTLSGPLFGQAADQAGWKCAYNEKKEWKCVYVADPKLPTPPPATTKYCNILLFYCPSNQTQVPVDYPLVRRPRETTSPPVKCFGSPLHPNGIDPIDCQRCWGLRQYDTDDCPRPADDRR
jgi:hypothetical protein